MQVRKKDTSAIQNAVLGADGPLPEGAAGAKLPSLVTHRNQMRFLGNVLWEQRHCKGERWNFYSLEAKVIL